MKRPTDLGEIQKVLGSATLFRNYFNISCDWKYSSYPIRTPTLEKSVSSFDFVLLPSRPSRQVDKLRDQIWQFIGIWRGFSLLSLHFPQNGEVCWALRRIQRGKNISMPSPILQGKSALTGAQDISCDTRYFRKSQSDWIIYNSRPARKSSYRLKFRLTNLSVFGPHIPKFIHFKSLRRFSHIYEVSTWT